MCSQYGILRYDESYNLGDEIQSIAAQQFLPSVDFTIDRNTGHKLVHTNVEQKEDRAVKVIYNGWFDGQYCQFPPPESVEPFFISFHINEVDHTNDPSFASLNKRKLPAFKSLA